MKDHPHLKGFINSSIFGVQTYLEEGGDWKEVKEEPIKPLQCSYDIQMYNKNYLLIGNTFSAYSVVDKGGTQLKDKRLHKSDCLNSCHDNGPTKQSLPKKIAGLRPYMQYTIVSCGP